MYEGVTALKKNNFRKKRFQISDPLKTQDQHKSQYNLDVQILM